MDIVGAIMDYEDGNLSARGELELFGELVRTGQAWTLQGHYGRMARRFIDEGLLYEDGELTGYAEEVLYEWEMS